MSALCRAGPVVSSSDGGGIGQAGKAAAAAAARWGLSLGARETARQGRGQGRGSAAARGCPVRHRRRAGGRGGAHTHQQDDAEVAAGLLHPARQLGGAGSLKPWPACGQVGRRQQLGHSSLLSTPHTISSAPLAQHHPPPRIIPYPAGKRDNRATCRPSCCGAPAPGRRRPRCPAPRLHSTGSSRCSSRCSSSRCSSSSSRR